MKTYHNVNYGNHQHQTMDVYLPEKNPLSPCPVIVMIHGGAWNTGDKSSLAQHLETLKKRLPIFAIININYRLAVDVDTIFPAQENDINAALAFVISHEKEYNISNDFILLGVSAGGYLALLHAYKNNSNGQVKKVISFFGPTELTDMHQNSSNQYIPYGLEQLTGTTPDLKPETFNDYSPLHFVSKNSPPTLLLHGGKDRIVNSSQSLLLHEKLNKFNVENYFIFYREEGHGWYGKNLEDSFNKIVEFINEV